MSFDFFLRCFGSKCAGLFYLSGLAYSNLSFSLGSFKPVGTGLEGFIFLFLLSYYFLEVLRLGPLVISRLTLELGSRFIPSSAAFLMQHYFCKNDIAFGLCLVSLFKQRSMHYFSSLLYIFGMGLYLKMVS